MESKKINQLATNVAPQTSDLTIIGDPTTGVSKKITLLQIANLFATTGTVSSVAVTETGDALTITGSPITSAGTINIGFAGDATQYVRGDGALADFPTSTGGGSSVSYYLNSSVSQGTIGGVAYRELSKDPISGAGTDITISADGYIASYITDANDPALLEVPGGNFNCEFYFSVNSNNHDPYVYAELYKYDGSTFTLLGSSQSVPEYLSNGTTLSPYYFAIPVATAVLSVTDRLAIRIYVNVDGRVVTLHTENNHLCQVVTTFSKGLTSLNNLTRQVQFLATGTSGTDFAISSSTATHTFNLPVASATNTGKLSSTDWSTFNGKYNLPSLTSGSVLFSNGTTIAQNNANFFWDNTNSFLGIGTNVPSAGVTSFSTTAAFQFKAAGTAPAITFSNTLTSASLACVFGLATSNNQFITGTAAGDMAIANQSTSAGAIVFGTGTTEKMRMTSAGTFSIGNTNSTYNLDVTGTGRFTGSVTSDDLILTAGTLFGTGNTGFSNRSSDSILYLQMPTNGFNITDNLLNNKFTLSSAGAGVFSSTLIANNNISAIRSGSSLTTLGQSRYLNLNDYFGNTNARMEIGFGYSAATGVTNVPAIIGFLQTAATDLTKGDLYFATRDVTSDTAPTVRLTIASSGEATFTGALSGTSATFSGNMAIGGTTITDANMLNVIGNQSSVNIGVVLNNTNSTHARIYALQNVNGNFNIRDYTASSDRLSISSTGAATFSSTITSGDITTNGNNKGLYFNGTRNAILGNASTEEVVIATANATRMTINSSGNVGIGTSSPSQKLTIDSSGGYPFIDFKVSGTGYGDIGYNTAASAFTIGAYSTTPMAFYTNSSERMRITSSGDVLMGKSAQDAAVDGLQYRGAAPGLVQITRAGGEALQLWRYTSNGKMLVFYYAGSEVGSISSNSNSLPSDLNFKKDISNISLGLNLITKLRPVHYRHKLDDDNEALSNGIIAQELEQALSDCGIEKNSLLMLQHKPNDKEGESQYWVDYTKMIPILVNAIKEQQAQIEELKALINK